MALAWSSSPLLREGLSQVNYANSTSAAIVKRASPSKQGQRQYILTHTCINKVHDCTKHLLDARVIQRFCKTPEASGSDACWKLHP